jgi:hypothetical protein
MISRTELSTKCRNRKDLHRGLVQDGWYLPDVKHPICSVKFLKEIITDHCYCPKLNSIQFKNCFMPPSNEILIGFYQEYVDTTVWAS